MDVCLSWNPTWPFLMPPIDLKIKIMNNVCLIEKGYMSKQTNRICLAYFTVRFISIGFACSFMKNGYIYHSISKYFQVMSVLLLLGFIGSCIHYIICIITKSSSTWMHKCIGCLKNKRYTFRNDSSYVNNKTI